MLDVCILCAGIGSRVNFSDNFHKALLPINNIPAISHIIDSYPVDTKFVIALGHNANLIRDYLSLTKKNLKVDYVYIRDYSGKESGPGATLLKCKKYLKGPFISHACDTIIEKAIKTIKYDWIGVAKVSDKSSNFLRVVEKNRRVDSLSHNLTNRYSVFTGVAGIKSYKFFWKSLKEGLKNNIRKEMYYGFSQIIELNKMHVRKVKWHDTGTDSNYFATKKYLEKPRKLSSDPLVVYKENECIYFENKKVIKLFQHKSLVEKKFKRASIISTRVPPKVGMKGNYLYYNFVEGKMLNFVNEKLIFKNFLEDLKKNFWNLKKLNSYDRTKFSKDCKIFYKKKTYERVKKYMNLYSSDDKIKFINNVKVDGIINLLNRVNWEKIIEGIPVNFHGDLAPNNVIVNEKSSKFYLIDWREAFGNNQKIGDIYYDLSKLYHAFIISQRIIPRKAYKVNYLSKNKVKIEFTRFNNLKNFTLILEEFIIKNGLDVEKLKLMSVLIFLNIAPLHEKEYAKLLFFAGKIFLQRFISGNRYNLWKI
tara:strand:+ start:4123 stop:5724 length:1602 start_codon:yes stop_codon:yes gene_type:complete